MSSYYMLFIKERLPNNFLGKTIEEYTSKDKEFLKHIENYWLDKKYFTCFCEFKR